MINLVDSITGQQMRRRHIPFLLMHLIITSCLDPAGDNFVDIDAPNPSQITLELSDITKDTILIDGPTVFDYQLNGYPLRATEIDVHIGNQEVFATTSYGNSFEVNPSVFRSGYSIMSITITASTQNGSLANRLDEEYFEISRQFHVIIENDPAPPAEIIKLDSANGVLTIFWNKYPRQNFTRYEVTKLCFDGYVPSSCWETSIETANDTSWTDPGYVGGKVVYRVDVVTEVGFTRGIEMEYNWQPEIVITMENGFSVMSWSKPLYYAHSVGYHVSPGVGFPFEAAVTDTSHTPTQRVPFGRNHDFGLTIVSDIQRMSAEFKKQYYVGTRKFLPSVPPFLYNSRENLYYGRSSPGLVVMDEDLNVIGSVSTRATWKISPNGQYFITIIGNDFYETNPFTLETTTLLLQAPSVYGANQVVADNGLIGFQTSTGYRVMDLNSGQEKYADNSTPYQNLSPSGNYLIRFRDVLHYDGTSFVYEGTLTTDFGLTYIFDENDDLIASRGHPTYGLATFDIETRTRTLLLDLSNLTTPLHYDPVSGKAMILSGWYEVFNPATGETESVSPRFTSLFNGRFFTYENNYVYTINHTYIE